MSVNFFNLNSFWESNLGRSLGYSRLRIENKETIVSFVFAFFSSSEWSDWWRAVKNTWEIGPLKPFVCINAKQKFSIVSYKISLDNQVALDSVKKTARTWMSLAVKKKSQAVGLPEEKIFEDALICSGNIQQAIGHNMSTRCQFEVLECKDENSVTQGIALVHLDLYPRAFHLDDLVTNPCNIRSHLNLSESGRVSGVGTALIRAVLENCINNNKDLVFTPQKSAIPFYRKLGFSRSEMPSPSVAITVSEISKLAVFG